MTEENLLESEIPEKFKDPDTGEVRIEDMARSYKELEKRLSQQPAIPKGPEEYCIECGHGLFEPDHEINQRLHAKGFSQEQAQEVYDLAAEKMMPMIAGLSADVEADRQVEKLINHFGGADQWKIISKQILAFAQKNLPAEVLQNLSTSYDGVLALHRLMKSEEPGLSHDGESQGSVINNEQDLKRLMKDPRYWKHKDPEFVKKVTQGYQDMYGS